MDLLWWTQTRLRNEKGQAYEFSDRAYLREIYDCWAPRLVIKKAAQMGATAYAVNRALWLTAHHTATAIYTMPTSTDVQQFSQARFNPSIRHSDLGLPMFIDNVGVKNIGGSFIYFRGATKEEQAISVPSDFNIHDEIDRSRPDIVEMYEERLSASRLAWRLAFSTPTLPNYGIDALYEESDQRQWHVKCENGHEQIITLDNIIDNDYRCRKCRARLNRRSGRWIAGKPSAPFPGYQISQLIAPWITAAQILAKRDKYRFKRDFFNLVLAEAYAGGEGLVTRADIINCLSEPRPTADDPTYIGVDWGNETHVVVRRPGIILALLKVEGDTRTHAPQVAEIMSKYNAIAGVDFGYGDTKNSALRDAHPGKVWTISYPDSDMKRALEPKADLDEQHIEVDRTRSLEATLSEIKRREIEIFPSENLEEFIKHHLNLTEETKEDRHGKNKTVITHVGRDDYVHANNYARLAEGQDIIDYAHISDRSESRSGDREREANDW